MIALLLALLVYGHPTAAADTAAQDSSADVSRPKAGLFDELVELYPDSDPAAGAVSLTIDAARGTTIGAHVLVRDPHPAAALSFRFEGEDGLVADADWFRLIDVPVEENTGLASRTERFDGRENPHVIRRAPFRIFEAIQPVTSPLGTEPSEADETSAVTNDPVIALRIALPIAPDAPVGNHRYRIVLGAEDWTIELEWNVVVHTAAVPPIGRDTLCYTNWFSPAEIAKQHDLELWGEPFWEMLARYAKLMAAGRQNTFWVRWGDMFDLDESGNPRLERHRLERYVQVFLDAGPYYIEGAPFARRPGGDWSSPELELGIVNLPTGDAQGQAALALMCRQMMNTITENNWEDRWIQHLADEPTDTNAEAYKALADSIRNHMPGLPIVEATMSRELAGALDIWCPQVQKYQAHQEFFEQRRAEGDRIWVYTCLIPGGPWLNRMLDMERLRQTYIGWAAVKYDLHGFLHWGLNHYKADPFAQSVVDHPSQPHTNNCLPAGDTHIIYPGPDGPWSSHRFEAHRIGMEDYELLMMLKAVDPTAAEAVIGSVVRAFDDYSTDIEAYRQSKNELLNRLDSCILAPSTKPSHSPGQVSGL